MMITNFAAGELGPQLNGRTDIQQYFQGSSKLLNFDVIPTGGLERRKGSERIGQLSGACRLIPFILDQRISFIMEFAPSTESGTDIYIWKNGEKMLDKFGQQIKLQAPWNSLLEIKEIQYAQNYNNMIFVQKNHTPFMVTYNEGTDTFTYGEMKFDFTPNVELDDDYDYIDIVDVLPDAKNSSGYVICNGYLYIWKDTKWVLDNSTDEYQIDKDLFTKEGKYPGAVAFFNGRLFFAATKENQQKVWASASPNLEGTRYNDFSNYVKYVTVNKVLKDPDVHFFTADAIKESDTLINVTQDLTQIENLADYYVTGTNIVEGTKAVSATWNEDKQQGTLKLTNAVSKEGTVQMYSIQKWVNRLEASSNDYEYKVVNNNMTNPDNSFFFELASDQNDGIKWLANATQLIIGTESATYVMNSQSNATMQIVIMNGRYGTDNLQATVVDNAVIYFANGRKGIKEYYWNQEANSFRSNNLALLAPQMLTESKAVDFDFMTNPFARILITRDDGSIAELLYDKTINIQAWSRLALGAGHIESVAVTRGNGASDFLYMAVNHDSKYYLERINSDVKIYLDSWKIYLPDMDINEYPGAVLFNATQDKVCENIAEIPEDFMTFSDLVYIGYKYKSEVVSMPVVNNDTMGKKRIVNLIVRFYNSYKPKLIVDKKKETFTNFDEPFSGLKEIVYPGNSDRDVYFTLAIDNPRQCNILSINAKLD